MENIENTQDTNKLKELVLLGFTKLNKKIEMIKNEAKTSTVLEEKLYSDNLVDLAEALAKAQGEIDIAGKTSNGYNFKYADFAEIVKASRPALSKNGLAVLQPINNLNGKKYLITILLHSSGQWIKSILEIPDIPLQGKTPVQSFGATLSYLKRYSYASLIGVITSNEDDLDKINNGR